MLEPVPGDGSDTFSRRCFACACSSHCWRGTPRQPCHQKRPQVIPLMRGVAAPTSRRMGLAKRVYFCHIVRVGPNRTTTTGDCDFRLHSRGGRERAVSTVTFSVLLFTMSSLRRDVKSHRGRPSVRNPDFGPRLRAARRQLQLSQAALAARIGITARSIIRYEAGKSFPPTALLADLAMALNVDLASLTRGPSRAEPGALGNSRRPVWSSGLIRSRPQLSAWYWQEMAGLAGAGWPDDVLDGAKGFLERIEEELAALFGVPMGRVSDAEVIGLWRDHLLPALRRRRQYLDASSESAA